MLIDNPTEEDRLLLLKSALQFVFEESFMNWYPLVLIRCCCVSIALSGLAATTLSAATVDILFDSESGWTASDPDFVSFSGGQATISESNFDNEIRLSRQFIFPASPQALSFYLVAVGTEPDEGSLPDAFNVSLLNPISLASVVPTVDVFTDAYYTRDLLNGVAQGLPATGVKSSPNATAVPLKVSLDVSALSGVAALLQFKLIGGGVDYSSSVTLNKVQLTVVPEPSSWFMILACAGLWIGRRRRTKTITARENHCIMPLSRQCKHLFRD